VNLKKGPPGFNLGINVFLWGGIHTRDISQQDGGVGGVVPGLRQSMP